MMEIQFLPSGDMAITVEFGKEKSPVVRWGIYYILIFIIVFLQGTPADFIYFQF